MTTVLKIGGELLEDAEAMARLCASIHALAARNRLVVVHGAGRAIDAELRARGQQPKFVDGLRITDEAALESVVSVLAGRTNTAFVAALHAAGVKAVGLTGADTGIGLAAKAPAFRTTAGAEVDLGLVGQPVDAPVTLLRDLTALGYVPVIASIGVTPEGTLLNVNADTLAGHLAGLLHAVRLVIAGGTTGVLDSSGRTIAALTSEDIDNLIASGEAHSGMVAKLVACRAALDRGVREVSIIAGKDITEAWQAGGTRVTRTAPQGASNEVWSGQ